jgi:ferrochelatase
MSDAAPVPGEAPVAAPAPEASLAGVGVVLLHRGDPPSDYAAQAWLASWYADPYAFSSSFGRGTQKFFGSLASRLDAGTWRKRLLESGGTSPLFAEGPELAGLLEKACGAPVRFATLYAPPLLKTALADLKSLGATRIVGLSLYPQKCDRFTRPLARALEEAAPELTLLDRYATAKGYVEALRSAITEGLERAPNATVLFCALPIERSDAERGDPYVDQLKATVTAVMEGMTAQGQLAWLSDDAPGISAEGALQRLQKAGTDTVVLVPLGSAVDELQTVHAVDVTLRQTARQLGFQKIERARSPVGYQTFVEALHVELKAHVARVSALGFVGTPAAAPP